MMGAAGSFTSCKDYDDDIDNLQNQIDAVKVDVDALKELIKSGKVIKDVTSNNDGIVITMTDGQTYTIKNGAPGKDAIAWTINEDGYWCQNGVPTEWKAVGEPGAAGAQGPQGPAGEQGPAGSAGENGKYYVPNAETGYFDIYQDGERIGPSDVRWRAESGSTTTVEPVTAVFNGTSLTLSGVVDKETGEVSAPMTIQLGTPLTSIAFIPETYNAGLPSATFYKLGIQPIDVAATPAGESWKKSDALKLSNNVDFAYRLNPTGALVEPKAKYEFLTRNVKISTSRAAGDNDDLLSVVDSAKIDKEEGVLTVKAALDFDVKAKIAEDDKDPIAALKLTNGQDVYVSDYTYIRSANLYNIMLVDSASSNFKEKVIYQFMNRYRAQKAEADESISDYINSCNSGREFEATMAYDQYLDLSTLPGLATKLSEEYYYLADLGFTGMNYKFSLPKEYKAYDGTDQQWFVKLDGTKLSLSDAITGSKTQAIGRTPVVLVDAYIGDKLVATAFIKVKITDSVVIDKPVEIDFGTEEYKYSDIPARTINGEWSSLVVSELKWQDFNNKIYGQTYMTADKFWSIYDYVSATVTTTITKKSNGENEDVTIENVSTYGEETVSGIEVYAPNWGGSATTTTDPILIGINNRIHTQEGFYNNNINTPYADVDDKGAKYVITITYEPTDATNKAIYKPVTITQTIYVKEEHDNALLFNDLYVDESKANLLKTSGEKTGTGWTISLDLTDAFKTPDGTSVFTYFDGANLIGNVKYIKNLKMVDASKDKKGNLFVDYDEFNHVLKVNQIPMTAETLKAYMQYEVILANDETCTKKYNFEVEFINPFKGVKGTELKIDGNNILGSTTDAYKNLVVKDFNGKVAYNYDTKAKALTLSELATKGYNVNGADVTYEFKNDDAYKTVKNNLKTGKLEIDPATGVVTYAPESGVIINGNHTLTINATVTLSTAEGELSKVVSTIPFTITGK